MNDIKSLIERLTRPIIGIESRTAQEAFDIMADRIRSALQSMSGEAGVEPFVAEYAKSDGTKDYFAALRCDGREMTLFKHTVRGRAEYEVAELNWLLHGGDKPNMLDWLDRTAEAAPPSPAVVGEVPEDVRAMELQVEFLRVTRADLAAGWEIIAVPKDGGYHVTWVVDPPDLLPRLEELIDAGNLISSVVPVSLYRSLPSASRATPVGADGWKMVPVKATEAMLEAGASWTDYQPEDNDGLAKDADQHCAKRVYAAMLAAAPSPSASEGGE